ncbi:MAG: DUF502 domain-containing protein [Maricaulaceae bacterium]
MTDNITDDMKTAPEGKRTGFVRLLRNRLLTGMIVALPIATTLWLITSFVTFVDNFVLTLIPKKYLETQWVDITASIPGLGLIVAILSLILLGSLASNFIGTSVIKTGERLLARVPVVSNIYNFLKQIVTAVAQQSDRSFKEVCLIEYPRPGLWAVAFVTADLQGAPYEKLGDGFVCVFVPTTPNPTSGFLLFVKRDDIQILDMTPEEGAKMIISGGMVSSNEDQDLAPEPKRIMSRKNAKTAPKDPTPSL